MNSENDIRLRISQLTSRLHSEVRKANSSYQTHLELLATECNQAIGDLAQVFNKRLEEAQKTHVESVVQIEKEIDYLQELFDSQHLMLQNNVDYIKELEQRFSENAKQQEGL